MKAFLITLLVYISEIIVSNVSSKNPEPSQRLEDLCNPAIPEDRNMELHGECRSSLNCMELGGSANCVYKRENYCQCETAEENEELRRKPYRKWNNLCKSNGGVCRMRNECGQKNILGRHCRNRGYVCCKKPCNGRCQPPFEVCRKRLDKCVCKRGAIRDEATQECLPEGKHGDMCKEDKQCVDFIQICDQTSGTCDCIDGTEYNDTYGECVKPLYTITYMNLPVMIRNIQSGYVMEIEGASMTAGARILTADYTGAPEQMWGFDGTYIYSKLNGLVLGIDGIAVTPQDYNGGNDQKWSVNEDNTITNPNTKAMDIEGGNSATGKRIIVWGKHGLANQQFQLVIGGL